MNEADRRHLCINCLEDGAEPFPVGPELGNQRDPYHLKVDLCGPCQEAMAAARFDIIHERYRSERTISRGEPAV